MESSELARVMCVGHAVQDYIFSLPELPAGGRKFRATAFESVGGGPAATAAVAIARLGGKALLAARVGEDATGREIIAELEGYGVDCTLVRRHGGCTSSLSAVMIDSEGERMIVNYRDDALPAGVSFPPETPVADAVLADTRWPEGAKAAFAHARRLKIPAILDADDPVPDDEDLLGAATHIAFSADGLCSLTRTADIRDGLRLVLERYGVACCATDGARGAVAVEWSESGALTYTACGAYAVAVVDTLGAGDVWHGAFALRLAEGRDEPEDIRNIRAMQFANAAAAIKVSRRGGRKGAPTRAEVDAFLKTATPKEPML